MFNTLLVNKYIQSLIVVCYVLSKAAPCVNAHSHTLLLCIVEIWNRHHNCHMSVLSFRVKDAQVMVCCQWLQLRLGAVVSVTRSSSARYFSAQY